MEQPHQISIEMATRVGTAVQIGCVGCKNACAFSMDGLHGMLVVDDMQRTGAQVPFSVTEAVGVQVEGKFMEDSRYKVTVNYNGGLTANDTGQCGEPCTQRLDIVRTAAVVKQARGVPTRDRRPR